MVVTRNKLLRRLDMMAKPAMEVTPANGMVIEFDTVLARQFLDEIDRLTPRISAGMEQLNQYADRKSSPKLRWQSVHIDFGC